ncbi:MAG: hypothetical protein K8U03_07825 [Planctomycetia bacterium]|nr:hypothetical protein [Planctomycetia bacterium]
MMDRCGFRLASVGRKEIVGKETVVKRIFFALTAVCFAAAAGESHAQYQQPYSRYAQPQQARANPQAARPAYGVQQTAMRPGTNTYAASPATAYALKPVNPPSPATQRLLMANRTQPTPAPAPVAPAAPASQARSNVRLPASPAAQNWNAPPYAQYDTGAAYGSGSFGGGGSMGAAPIGPQPDPNVSGGPVGDGGAAPCDGGQCGGGGCGIGGCCGLGALRGCCCLGGGGLCQSCCLRTTGDLVQHMPFFGTTHGYYYFRPYHVMHVFSQQELATRWGGDPRNPYDNTMFQRTYEAMGVDAATQKAREEAAAKAKAAGLADPPVTIPDYTAPGHTIPTPLPGNYQGTMPYGAGQFAPGSVQQGNMYPQGGGFPGGAIPQGAMPNVPGPSIEYVPNR